VKRKLEASLHDMMRCFMGKTKEGGTDVVQAVPHDSAAQRDIIGWGLFSRVKGIGIRMATSKILLWESIIEKCST
jgi:hypothetical protein